MSNSDEYTLDAVMHKDKLFQINHSLASFFLVLLLWLCATDKSFAQFYFGRNKINYQNFQWSVLESDHFNIYFYKGEEKIADMALDIAEEAFDEFEIKFNLTINRTIPLIIYSNPIHFQQTNVLPNLLPEGVGGFFEFRKGRVVLPFNGNRKDFYHVVRHELVHVFTHYKISHASHRVGLLKSVPFPLWFYEGLAEYWATGYDTQADMFMRDAILHDYLIPLDSNELYFSGYLLYKEGQAFFKYYHENYGEERLRRIMRDYWKYDTFYKAVSAISGKSFRVIMQDWEFHLKKEYAQFIHEADISNFENRRLTNRRVQVSPAIFKADSSEKLIFMSNRWGYENLILSDVHNSKEEVLIRASKMPEYESLHLLQSRISVNNNGDLAFVAKSGGRDLVWIHNINDNLSEHSISSKSLVSIRSPQWNNNADKLVFSAQDTTGQSDLYIWDRNDDAIYQLTNDIYGDASPSFSPDGRYVAFSSDRGSENYFTKDNLYIFELSTGKIMQITFSDDKEIKPFWHPSKMNMIYYLSDRSGTDNLWAVHLPENNVQTGSSAQFVQLSDYYTGINDMHPDNDSSLILTNFSRYNFHLSRFNADSSLNSYQGSISSYQMPEKSSPLISSNKKPAKSYELKYSLDFAQSYVAYDPIFGRLGGAQLGVSDMLGNKYYNFLVANTSASSSGLRNYWNFAASRVDLQHRSNRAIGVFHFANDWYSPYEGYFFERNLGVRGALNYPINVFNRLEFSTSMWHSRREYFQLMQNRFLIANFVSYVHDNSLWINTGPIDGWRLRISAGPSFDLLSSQVNNYTFLGDFRYYYRLSERVCIAQRAMGFINEGKNIYRYYIGGSWHLRGYRRTEIFGKKFILFNTELRFPIAQGLVLHFREGGLGLAPVRGALFFDAGNAWDNEFPGFIGSFGFGLRAPLMGALVLRLDIGKRTDFQKIEKRTFYQFLFGWNF
jgi:Tol biopolymer transport system component